MNQYGGEVKYELSIPNIYLKKKNRWHLTLLYGQARAAKLCLGG